jgi:hypothetical protein
MPLVNDPDRINSAVAYVLHGATINGHFFSPGNLEIGGGFTGIMPFPVNGEVTGNDITAISTLITNNRNNPPALNTISFASCIVGDITTQLDALLSANPTVKRLEFLYLTFSKENIETLEFILKKHRNILELVFWDVQFKSDADIVKLSTILRNSSLQRVVFDRSNLTFESVKALATIAFLQRPNPWQAFSVSEINRNWDLKAAAMITLVTNFAPSNSINSRSIRLRSHWIKKLLKDTVEDYNIERDRNILIAELMWSRIAVKPKANSTLFNFWNRKPTKDKPNTATNPELPRDVVRHMLRFLPPVLQLPRRNFLTPEEVLEKVRGAYFKLRFD